MEPHHHEHNHRITSLNKAFIIGIVLNISFVMVEFGVGFYYDSLGLLSDAGHNLGDVASLILAMLAFRLEKVHPNSRYTYGYKKSTILVSLLNAVILLVAVGIIIAESIDKLFHPVSVDGSAIAWTAGVGVVINALTAWLFMKDKDKDLNVKGAYLHMAADALVSVGVVVSGIIMEHHRSDYRIGHRCDYYCFYLGITSRQSSIIAGWGSGGNRYSADSATDSGTAGGRKLSSSAYLGHQYHGNGFDCTRCHR